MANDFTYESKIPWKAERKANTLVIHCSAFDLRPYFADFAANGLKLAEYDLVAVPGGVQMLTVAHYIAKVRVLMRKWLGFLVEHHNLTKVVIIGHDDCSWYKDFRFGPIHIDLKQRQIADLKEVAAILREEMKVGVDIYFAHIKDNKVSFTRVS
ncbi:MAG: hypothetical protein NTW66_00240 [Candidatus Magasanikbacteria bacterium]|nr:hypothetical protein [Candidatus Magasanikbacteria bacterium]